MNTFTYRMDHDLGFAPNPFFGWCTLACCKTVTRRVAQIGDIIVGMAGQNQKGLGRIFPQAIFWMRVDEVMTFDDYWIDPRFARKRPQMFGAQIYMVGDRTYRHEPGCDEWQFEHSMHYLPNAPQKNGCHVSTDTKVDKILTSETFTYWGNSGPEIPNHLIKLFPIRNHKRWQTGEALSELHEILGVHKPQLLIGEPTDWDKNKFFLRHKKQ